MNIPHHADRSVLPVERIAYDDMHVDLSRVKDGKIVGTLDTDLDRNISFWDCTEF